MSDRPICPSTGKEFDPRPRQWTALAGAGAIAIGAAVGLILPLLLRRPVIPAAVAAVPPAAALPSGSALSDQVLAIKIDADVLAFSGQLQAAADKYHRIRELLQGRTGDDSLLKNISRQVDEAEQRLHVVLAAGPNVARAAPDQASDFAPPQGSDFPNPADAAPATAPSSQPTAPGTQPSRAAEKISLAEARGIGDQQIGSAIEAGAHFLLSQFKDGQIATDIDLTASQTQALDALCVYALVQSSKAISDPRLNIHGRELPDLLERLRSFPIESDGQATNRPITYGRSLRAAALATYDRPEDRDVLKADVAWLIKAQIGGAYTYDDLYNQLIAQGIKPTETPGTGGPVAPPPSPKSTDEGGFAGGSPAPSLDGGPYDSPTSVAPPRPTVGVGLVPRASPAPGAGGTKDKPIGLRPAPSGVSPLPMPRRYSLEFPRPYMSPPPRIWFQFPRPGPLWIRPPNPSRSVGPPGVSIPDGEFSGGPVGDNQVPKLERTFEFPWDNSNSQYGLLGVWAGAEVGMEVPDQYWAEVEHHWLSCELRTGEWAYKARETQGYFAMTCAGVASLLVTRDYLEPPMLKGQVGRPPYSDGLAAGLAWLERGDNSVSIPGPSTHYLGYDLFGIERIGLASGYKFFGAHDWYRELAGRIVPMQFPNSAWGHEDHGVDAIVDTAYTLLFLARGRHPVIMTKLKFDKYWDNRPRDLSNLARFAGRELERPLNWQVVGIEHEWQDWFDSPVLYVASHEPPRLKEADYGKLKSFVLAGGLIFTHADADSVKFNKWADELAGRIVPGRHLEPIPPGDPIYSLQYKLRSHPRLLGLSNGVRWLMVHSPGDIALSWQQRSDKNHREDFELGTNVFLYASGKPDLRNRLDSPFIPPPPPAPLSAGTLVKLQYDGNWNPEPAAWRRFARYFQWEANQLLAVTPMPIEKLAPGAATIAALTGTDAHTFTEQQIAAMKAYVEAGGVLLIDACGGENAFARSVRESLLRGAFALAQPQPLPANHPLFSGLKAGQANASPLRLRPYARDRLGRLAPQIQLYRLGKGYIVFSPLDLTSGLLGTNTWGILGYEPASAQTFAKNLVLWARQS